MNKDNAKDFLPLVQALADGKAIQQQSENGNWHDLPEVNFGCDIKTYRIKPEPREWDLWERKGILVNVDMTNKDGWEKIRVREILD